MWADLYVVHRTGEKRLPSTRVADDALEDIKNLGHPRRLCKLTLATIRPDLSRHRWVQIGDAFQKNDRRFSPLLTFYNAGNRPNVASSPARFVVRLLAVSVCVVFFQGGNASGIEPAFTQSMAAATFTTRNCPPGKPRFWLAKIFAWMGLAAVVIFAAPAFGEDLANAPLADDGWRRTEHGWENVQQWRTQIATPQPGGLSNASYNALEASITAKPYHLVESLHPTNLALLMVIATVLGFYFIPPSEVVHNTQLVK